ncbi:hypothetical protein CHS0354_027576 [Potamilus streckersoni]|uniref:Uncharacterized protein n=1 Tax=Potamilus streckersoni TaxID=2493646 RepID=A0AAE0S3A9_9BIVA|nr:hypothetical protein CHS0354_027576 [Potamilus streckersoni]
MAEDLFPHERKHKLKYSMVETLSRIRNTGILLSNATSLHVEATNLSETLAELFEGLDENQRRLGNDSNSIAITLETTQSADKQPAHRMTAQVRTIGDDDVECTTSRIMDIQACIKYISSEIRYFKVEMGSLKQKCTERPFNERNLKKCWILGSEENLRKDCLGLRANRTRQVKQGRTQPRTTQISSN